MKSAAYPAVKNRIKKLPVFREPIVPLKVGIFNDIVKELSLRTPDELEALKLFFWIYTRKTRYKRSFLVPNAMRHDLNRNAIAALSEAEINHSKDSLEAENREYQLVHVRHATLKEFERSGMNRKLFSEHKGLTLQALDSTLSKAIHERLIRRKKAVKLFSDYCKSGLTISEFSKQRHLKERKLTATLQWCERSGHKVDDEPNPLPRSG